MKTYQQCVYWLLLLGFTFGSYQGLFAASHNVADKIHLKGDFRLRQEISEKQSQDYRRIRQRIRFRLGGTASVLDQSKVQFGLATGGNEARSTNQTLENQFQTPDIRLDYAFIQHQLSPVLQIMGGKMKNPLWMPSDLLWDSDIRPDGVSFSYEKTFGNRVLFATASHFILDEKTSQEDPCLTVIQPGIKWAIDQNIKGQVAMGGYLSQHLEKSYQVLAISGKIDFYHRLFGVNLLQLFSELVINTKANDQAQGMISGIKFGDQKVKGLGMWQSTISYRYLQSNAWFDFLADSDAYGGNTNTKGFEIIVNYGLSEKVSLGVDFYLMDQITGVKNEEALVQFDLNAKF